MYTAQSSSYNILSCLHIQHASTFRRPEAVSGAGNNGRPTKTRKFTQQFSSFKSSFNGGHFRIQAVTKGENKSTDAAADEDLAENKNIVNSNNNPDQLASTHNSSLKAGGSRDVTAVITLSRKIKERLTEKVEGLWESLMNRIGRGMVILLISEETDPGTNSGKSIEFNINSWSQPSDQPHYVEYVMNLTVPSDFGSPGAILFTNLLDKEIHLVQILLHGLHGGPIVFPANTWIHSHKDNPEARIIFKNQAYLPSQTPAGIKDLRREDLLSLRGNRKGERKPHERVYDYDVYNDLGNPDKSDDLFRPFLGSQKRPYPRRCRTGRPPTKKDPLFESTAEASEQSYVPRDENFEELKQQALSASRLRGILHNLIPSIADAISDSDLPFSSFSDVDKLYNDGLLLKDEDKEPFLSTLLNRVSNAGQRLLKFDVPAVVRGDRLAWLRDSEFGRQALAGVNPISIELLKEFPLISKLDPEEYGPPESAITRDLIEKQLNGMSFEEAMEKRRLFTLDYHDILLPYVERINNLPGKKTYASRTIFFHTDSGILQPIVIELSLPPDPFSATNKRVFTSGNDATTDWLWRLAKAHVCSHDASIHHFVSHWLRIHACSEPYIIATHRHLSSIHPIYKLLHPHMRYTLEIDAIARQSLINAGGIMETNYIADRYGLEISSDYYKSTWRFDSEGLPADLLRRGMAVEDASEPSGVKLLIEDYPYAADGLLIWCAIKEFVESYVNHYYPDLASIADDYELQAWWNEIQEKGHPEKRDEPWWPKLTTEKDLSSILVVIIWVASGHHAAINFSQYTFGSHVLHRPTFMRKLVPKEEDPDYEKFLLDPEHTFLSSLPTQFQASKVMAMLETVSAHSPDEEYLTQLHQLHSFSNNDEKILKLVENFSTRLEEIERVITRRNKDMRLKHRCGAGVAPYEQLLPSSGPGVTGRGVPNSISS